MRDRLRTWRHVFKIDPDRNISDQDLERLCMSGTDAIIIGGSSGVTFENTVDLLSRVRRYELPCVLEVSSAVAVVPGFDLYFVPMVLNTHRAEWIIGYHHQAIKQYGITLPWEQIVIEGYVILNPLSTVAQLTSANTLLDLQDLQAYAEMAENMLQLPILYIEYSGTFGDMEFVTQTKKVLENTRLFYGGGIDSLEKARQAAEAAHTIVVGNVIYENLQVALETVSIKDGNVLK